MDKLKSAVKAQWLEALRSGNYKQGQGALRRELPDGNKEYCCLGVLCDLYAKETNTEWIMVDGRWFMDTRDDLMPIVVSRWAFEPGEDPDYVPHRLTNPAVKVDGKNMSLSGVNDGGGSYRRHSFEEIADLIEESL